ncbi:probable ARC35 - subunit of the Arp2/3 complex [Ustilago trichophora]|uniref:Arp2/3 complex 34 kDa subunit n=1 Tax=Ustilago trichophora TaxID=86804 RepID=A0A5C3E1Z0_9BASI|nr:probable ARC35 - subunit of the Arp2/3 complex [Ustilago trichophora]
MILLGTENIIIRDVLTEKFERPASVDQTFTDFDGVAYHLESTSKAGPLTLSMDIRCWSELVQAGALDVLKREYGSWIRDSVEPEYSVTLEFDYAKVPAAGPERDALIANVSLLKRHAMAAPFERAFALQKQLEEAYEGGAAPSTGTDIMPINYRDDEAIYVIPSADRVTVVFTTTFKEETDKVLGKVFLQEFVDARRQPSIQNAPQVLYSNREPPLEVRNVQGLNRGDDVGYVTFVLFPRHFANAQVMENTISRIQLFRDYLHYHIKCSKAYMHSRMRHRVAEFLKVLNRAKPELAEKERKTASGRTFRRA